MIDEELRSKMVKAYSEGRFEEALELSKKLDKQVLECYLDKTAIKQLNDLSKTDTQLDSGSKGDGL